MFLTNFLLPKKLQDGFYEDLLKNHNEIYFWLINPSKAPSTSILDS
jgi:hypothetical protein